MTFQLEVWSKTEDVVQTLLQVRSYSETLVAPGLGGTFRYPIYIRLMGTCVCFNELSCQIGPFLTPENQKFPAFV